METRSWVNGKRKEVSKDAQIIRLSLLAFRDDLTHAFNRRFLRLRLPEILERARKTREQISLLMLDIDDFKKINDCYFHCEGDRVLVEVAYLLKNRTRAKDIVVRYGGDEFVVILPDTNPTDARAIASRWVQDSKSITVGNHQRIPVTLSIGIATYPVQGETVDTLLQEADQALYKTKRNGKNGYSSFGTQELQNRKSPAGEIREMKEYGFLSRHLEKIFN